MRPIIILAEMHFENKRKGSLRETFLDDTDRTRDWLENAPVIDPIYPETPDERQDSIGYDRKLRLNSLRHRSNPSNQHVAITNQDAL